MACLGLLPNFTVPAGFKVAELPPGYRQSRLWPPGCAGSFDVFNYVAAEVLCESGSTWRHMPAPMLAQVRARGRLRVGLRVRVQARVRGLGLVWG